MASKFKLPSIEEWEKQQKQEEENNAEKTEQGKKIAVGSWLFENTEPNPHALLMVNIKREQIEKNENNHYSIEGIPSLAESIKHYGLVEPLHVTEIGDKKYKLLGGERRLTAIDMLIADESVEEWTEKSLIPCIVKGIDEVKLDLSDENKERYAIITTNKEQREYSDADKYNEILQWKMIIEELRAKGIEYLEQVDEDGNQVQVKIKGEKTRDVLTQTTGMSRTQINRFETVHNQGSEDLKDAMAQGKISVANAEKVVKNLSHEEQDNLVAAINRGEEISINKEESELEEVNLTAEDFKKDIKTIIAALKKNQVMLNKEKQEKYHSLLKQIEKLIGEK